jgi:hypothetical protein
MNTDKINNDADLAKFLRGLGLTCGDKVLYQVVDAIEGNGTNSLYDLYTNGPRRDGTERTSICSKGTVSKIQRLYKTGELSAFLSYRKAKTTKVVNSGKPPADLNPDSVQPNQSSIVSVYKGRYHEEWAHFEKIKETIIQLQYATPEEASKLFDEIERERVTLDDEKLQSILTDFIDIRREFQHFNHEMTAELVAKLMGNLIQRMNKRYKRSR